jgi:apolipoprotein N-acyltransferase
MGFSKSAFRNPGLAIPETHLEEAAPAYSREDLLASRFRVARVLPYQRSSPPFVGNLSLAIFSGLLLVFAFPDWSLWSLGWVGTAPLIMAVVREQRFWRCLVLGTLTGTVFYIGSSSWVTYSMHNYGGIPLWLCYVILIVLSAGMGIFTGLFAAVAGLSVKRWGSSAVLAAPMFWVGGEWARIKVTGVGWNALGYSQAFQPAVIQVSRIGGVYLVSAIMVAASTSLVYGLVHLEKRRGIVVLTLAGVIALGSLLYGESLRPSGGKPVESTAAALVIQPNIPIDGPWEDPRFVDEMTKRHLQLSEQAIQEDKRSKSARAESTRIQLVIWPESTMNFAWDRDADLRRRVGEFTRRNQVYLLMNSWGFPAEPTSPESIYNSAMLVGPSGDRLFEYDKIALVPFGEFVPGRGWLPFAKQIHALVGDLTPGSEIRVSDAAGAKLGTTICFETTRPDIARRMRLEGATEFIQLSNELWFGRTAAPRQMLAHSILRAVENNTELIRSTNSGLSARVDAFGIVHDETPILATETRVWPLQTSEGYGGTTFYARHGDLFAGACLILSIVTPAAALIWRKKEDQD